MRASEPYDASDPELVADRRRCQEVLRGFNARPEQDLAKSPLGALFESVGASTFIEPPFLCDYGFNISIGSDSFINFGGVVLDVSPVSIGDQVRIATNVQLLTAEHPLDPVERRQGINLSRPLTIGDGVWLGAGVIVCPGVTVGENAVIGAGSVVTRDIPAGVLAVGNPCRVVRSID
ncbi:MAG: maltose O-acetyltransferase [Actinomycetota bacterium]|jgi:maltose O-acetyltransferase|nr:maltose O-acetyltransferase [Actinomycetota bacterium]